MFTRAQIPNLLTFARVAAVPLCLALMLCDPANKAPLLLWVFVAASITDFLDGYLARRWGVVSALGALLDPIADKLLVALLLLHVLISMGTELLLPVAVILLRELYISGLREFLAARQLQLPVSKGGKLKTALQMLAITVLLAAQAHAGDLVLVAHITQLGVVLLYLSALLAVTSAISYSCASWRLFQPRANA